MHEQMAHQELEVCAIETERLLLLPVSRDDAKNIARWRQIPANVEQFWAQRGPTLEEQLAWTSSMRKNRADYTIWHKHDQIALGTVSLASVNSRKRSAMSGTMIGNESYRGQGLAVEANNAWLAYAFDVLKLEIVDIYVREQNKASLKLHKKLGFAPTSGELDLIHPKRGRFVHLTLSRMSREKIVGSKKDTPYPLFLPVAKAQELLK